MDSLSEEDQEAFYLLRDQSVLSLVELQFVLTYRTHLTKDDVDNMTWFELRQWHALLKKQLKLDDEVRNA